MRTGARERCRPCPRSPAGRGLVACAVALLLSGGALRAGDEGWREVTGPPPSVFPADHGAHSDLRTEWWYLTANLEDGLGGRYGVQVTFFRRGLDPMSPQAGESPLRARHVLAAHLAIADVDGGRLRHAERLGRADGGGFCGFATDDLRVWLGDWEVERRPDNALLVRASDRAAGIGVGLALRPSKPLVAHGVGGYSRKGPDPGNASAYFSWTRLEVTGVVVLDGRRIQVTGAGWFDHEWGSSQLGEGVVGWDWFSLRLDGGCELMVYRLRREDGSPDRYSSGTFIGADGSSRRLTSDQVVLEPTGSWTSPASGGVYPSGWRIGVPSQGLELTVTPLVRAAELDGRASTGVVYWEGPVAVSGSHRGEGYAELTGYAGTLDGRF